MGAFGANSIRRGGGLGWYVAHFADVLSANTFTWQRFKHGGGKKGNSEKERWRFILAWRVHFLGCCARLPRMTAGRL